MKLTCFSTLASAALKFIVKFYRWEVRAVRWSSIRISSTENLFLAVLSKKSPPKGIPDSTPVVCVPECLRGIS